MSSIGSGPGIGSGPIVETSAVRAVGSADPAPVPPTSVSQPSPQTAAAASPEPVVTSTALDPGAAPVDQDRVASIREAIATNSYPLVPTKVGDAMIAAGLLLRITK